MQCTPPREWAPGLYELSLCVRKLVPAVRITDFFEVDQIDRNHSDKKEQARTIGLSFASDAGVSLNQ